MGTGEAEVHAWGSLEPVGILAASFPPPSCSIHGNETSPKPGFLKQRHGSLCPEGRGVTRGCGIWGSSGRFGPEQQGGRVRPVTARGPRAKPVTQKGAICSVVFKIFLIKIQVTLPMSWQLQVYGKVWFSYTYVFLCLLFRYQLSQVLEYSSMCSPVGPSWLSTLHCLLI